MEQQDVQTEGERMFDRMVFRGWVIVCGIAIAFVLYGFFAFFVIGDKGPPDWDYGSLPDVPGQSVYSTYPSGDHTVRPDPQHVSQKPPDASTGISPEQGTPIPGKQPDKEPARQ